MNKLVVLFCGIPGSGKSSIRRNLCDHLNSIVPNSATAIVYDDFQQQFDWDHESFHLIRHAATKQLESSLCLLDERDGEEQLESSLPFRHFIIIDDIMYLRSMRRQIYNKVRDQGDCALLTVFVKCDPDIARARNEDRVGFDKVASQSFENVVVNFQAPNGSHICDRNVVEVDSTEKSIDEIVLEIMNAIALSKERLQEIHDSTSDHNTSNKGNNENERYAASILKLIDDGLRKTTSKLLPALPSSLFIKDCPKIGNLISSEKSNFLKKARRMNFAEDENKEEVVRSLTVEFLLDVRLVLLPLIILDRVKEFEEIIHSVIR